MDADSQIISQHVHPPTAQGHVDGDLVVEHSIESAACTMCRRILAPDGESSDDAENFGLCGDCKFLLLEDFGTPTRDSHQRLPPRGRRIRYSSNESIENLFSQMINLVRQSQSAIPGHEDQSLDGDMGTATRLFQHSSSRTTPSDSRRWRRVLSDTESDGFDNLDSLYGESESNISFGRYRVFHGESDAISFSAYGGDSDASMDGHSFLDTEIFIQPEDGSIFDSDTDIDPLHAGMNQQWNLDDLEDEEDGEEEDGEWEEADVEEETVESTISRPQPRNFFNQSLGESTGHVNRHRQFQSPEFGGVFHWGNRGGRQRLSHIVFPNLGESGLPTYIGNSGDYLDARGFEELLEHLAETDDPRRGAPPAAMSFVKSLPRVIISEDHSKNGDPACAICKDILPIGTEVNQLPCLHLYHRPCILPWLNARNSCPLCRFELPTDDAEYEEGKLNISSRMEINEIRQQYAIEDSSSEVSDGAEAVETQDLDTSGASLMRYVDPTISSSGRERSRGRWFLLAAVPIAGLVGVVLVLWLGNPLSTRRGSVSQHRINVPGSASPNRRENRSRRWWSLF